VLLALVLTACSFSADRLYFIILADGIEWSAPDVTDTPSVTPTVTVTPSPTITPTIIPTNIPTATPSPTIAPTFEPSPTREFLNEVRVNSNVNVRSAPNGGVVRVASAGSTFEVLSQRDGWLQVAEGWVFFGDWVEFINGGIEAVPVSQSAGMRISYNVNGVAVPDWDYLWAHLERLQPTTLLIMDNIFRACEAVERLPNTVIIHRDYSRFEGEEWALRPNPAEWIFRWRGEGCYEVIRYLSNEPSLYDVGAFIASEIALMEAARNEGIRLAVGNFAVGTLPDWAVNQGLFDDWLRAVIRGNHIIGAHEYTTGILPFGVGVYSREQLVSPASMHPDNWVTNLPIEYLPFSAQSAFDPVRSPFGAYESSQVIRPLVAQSVDCGGLLPTYWHILRTTWLLLRAECIGLDSSQIQIINTEGLWDNLSDINVPGGIEPVQMWREQYGVDKYFRDMRGIPSYDNLWSAYFPQWSDAEAAVCQMMWWDYIVPENYVGVNLFTWSTNELWISFDVSGVQNPFLYEMHVLLERWSAGEDMRPICGDYDWAA
jgi:hypothetical protein